MRKDVVCYICGKEIVSKSMSSLRRHLKDIHNVIQNVEYSVKCRETNCSFSTSKLNDLRLHLEGKHQIEQEVDVLEFENLSDFNKWKTAEESRCITLWLKRSAIRSPKGTNVYYYCNRSGKKQIISGDQRKRRIKSQGSRKIDFTCTSSITACIGLQGIKVKYYKTHYGHDNETAHVPLSADDKSMIASQLIAGLAPEDILTKIKESSGVFSKRLYQTTKRDIANIAREFNLCDTMTVDKVPYKISRINKSHTVAANVKKILIIKFDDGWSVISNDKTYSVKTNNLEDGHLCKLKCSRCASCIHAYSCTCMDFVGGSNMCIHIHKVHMSEFGEKSSQEIVENEGETNNEKELQEQANYEEGMNEEEVSRDDTEIIPDIDMVKDSIRKNFDILLMSDWNSVRDPDKLKRINEHLTSALDLMMSEKELCDIQETMSEVESEAVEEQVQFISEEIVSAASPQLDSNSVKDAGDINVQSENVEETSVQNLQKATQVTPVKILNFDQNLFSVPKVNPMDQIELHVRYLPA